MDKLQRFIAELGRKVVGWDLDLPIPSIDDFLSPTSRGKENYLYLPCSEIDGKSRIWTLQVSRSEKRGYPYYTGGYLKYILKRK